MALRSGRRDHCSFKAYQNLLGRLGVKQQQDVLRAPAHKPPTSSDTGSTKRLENVPTNAQSNNSVRIVVGGVCERSVTVNINYCSDTT